MCGWLDWKTLWKEMRFDIEGTDLKGLTLKEVLRWAYHRYVLCDLTADLPEMREVATQAAES